MLKRLFTLPFPYHHGELVQQAFTQAAPKANEFVLHHPWVISKPVTGGWGSADVWCPFEETVTQHMMATAVNVFAGDGVFPSWDVSTAQLGIAWLWCQTQQGFWASIKQSHTQEQVQPEKCAQRLPWQFLILFHHAACLLGEGDLVN